MQTIPVNETIAARAAYLRAKYRLRTPDALHAATAIVSGCDAFLTNDVTFRRVNEIPILILDDLELDP
jgi:predicted nucleic acid-binding protein